MARLVRPHRPAEPSVTDVVDRLVVVHSVQDVEDLRPEPQTHGVPDRHLLLQRHMEVEVGRAQLGIAGQRTHRAGGRQDLIRLNPLGQPEQPAAQRRSIDRPRNVVDPVDPRPVRIVSVRQERERAAAARP